MSNLEDLIQRLQEQTGLSRGHLIQMLEDKKKEFLFINDIAAIHIVAKDLEGSLKEMKKNMSEMTNCPGCGKTVYKFYSEKKNTDYYCNSDSYTDFHNCAELKEIRFGTKPKKSKQIRMKESQQPESISLEEIFKKLELISADHREIIERIREIQEDL